MGNLLFSPSGRINSGDFMKGAIILTVIGVVLSMLQALAPALGLLHLVIFWCWIAIWVKRYHDGGKSGWMCLIPIIVYLVLSVIVLVALLGGEITTLIELANSGASPEEQQAVSEELMKGKTISVMVASVAVTLGIAFLFNKMIKGDPGDNQFGPNPITAEVFN